MKIKYLDFEKEVEDIDGKISRLKALKTTMNGHLAQEIAKLEEKRDYLLKEIYSNLDPWQITQVARHPDRPHTSNYINELIDDFIEFHGDRKFGDDPAIISGFGFLEKKPICIIGQEKGASTREKSMRNFGMPHPEGYRKAMRVMDIAERFNIPIVTLIDTPGAYPGIGAEERGQAPAIGESISKMFNINVPLLSVVIGEGGSGGALAIAIGNVVLMMQYAIYSVISPEGCASILWRTQEKAPVSAKALGITSEKLKDLGVIDDIIPEPLGGAHRDHKSSAKVLKEYILRNLEHLNKLDKNELIRKRFEKFRNIKGIGI